MNCHLPVSFVGMETIRQRGATACKLAKWTVQERMIPMPGTDTLDFAEAKAIVYELTGLEMGGWVIFARGPRHAQVLHSDCALGPADRAMCGLNVPVIGGPGSVMEWYSDRPMKMISNVYGTPESPRTARYYVPDGRVTKEEKPIDRCMFTDRPVLVDTYHPHRVISGSSRRAVVSIRFVGNPSFKDVVDYISRRHELARPLGLD